MIYEIIYGIILSLIAFCIVYLADYFFIKFNKDLFWTMYSDKILKCFEDRYLEDRWDSCE